MSNPRVRKRVGADPFPATTTTRRRRAPDGSGFMQCKKCTRVYPAATSDMHDCQRDAKIDHSLECHHTIDSAMKEKAQVRCGKRKAPEKCEAVSGSPKGAQGKTKRPKWAKDPNKPKRPKTAYFLFMHDFIKKFKETRGEAKGVVKQGSEIWKRLTEEEKMPYVLHYQELNMQYRADMAKYSAKLQKSNEEADSAEVGKIDTVAEAVYSQSSYGYSQEESDTQNY